MLLEGADDVRDQRDARRASGAEEDVHEESGGTGHDGHRLLFMKLSKQFFSEVTFASF